MSEMTVNYSG